MFEVLECHAARGGFVRELHRLPFSHIRASDSHPSGTHNMQTNPGKKKSRVVAGKEGKASRRSTIPKP
ncbi:uncharacterized protein LAJ45_10207 [Morchella importuna]|uniref:uncharacterized protein n=1 Tax=Morchella importuna TaxID=1174673 RepID=UPI001E8E87C7|nr:uncharacterized protein LAJ45_10207 [Morchella importuna]KAH8145730.1 hypothetical protein LAJ45_10207 [Morchella importuna]